MFRKVTGVVLWAALMAGVAGNAEAEERKGYLFYPTLISDEEGSVPPITIYAAETGEKISAKLVKPTLKPGQQYELPAGLYHVEVTQFPSPAARRVYKVVEGKVTKVKVGAAGVVLAGKPGKNDLCTGMSLNLTASVRHAKGFATVAADVMMETPRYGKVQLHEGEYLLEWNRLHYPVTVKEGKLLVLEPQPLAPVEGVSRPKLIEKETEGLERPGSVTPCAGGTTYLFPGEYTLSYKIKTNAYPFFERRTDSITVEEPRGFARYKSLPAVKGKARYFRGGEGMGELVAPEVVDESEKPDDPAPEYEMPPEALPDDGG